MKTSIAKRVAGLFLAGLPFSCLLLPGCGSSPTIRTMPVARHPTPIVSQPARSKGDLVKPTAELMKSETEPVKSAVAPVRPSVKKPKPDSAPSAIPVVPVADKTVKYTVQTLGSDANTRVELTPQADQLIVTVYAKSGKGGFSLQLLSGAMPRRIVLRLHQQKLFTLRVWADAVLFYDLNTSLGNETQQVMKAGQATYITSDHACWIDVTQGVVDNEAVYQAVLPPVLIGHPKKNDKLGIAWTGYNEAAATPVPANAPAAPR